MFFTAESAIDGVQLFSYDDSAPEGSRLKQETSLPDLAPEKPFLHDGLLYFMGQAAQYDWHLWSYDGVNLPVDLLDPKLEGINVGSISGLFNLGGKLVLQHPNEGIWYFDGDVPNQIWEGRSDNEKQIDDNLYVTLSATNEAGSYIGDELWVTDGVTPPTLVVDFNTSPVALDFKAVIDNPFGGEDSGLILTGDVSDDVLVSSPYGDVMTGKGGADRFVFIGDWAVDQILDFEDGIDVIDLSQTGLSFGDLNIEQTGLVTVIDDGVASSITLVNMTATDFSEEDFIFGE